MERISTVRILLLNPAIRLIKGEPRYASPPLGLAYIAASLEAVGCVVTIIDAVALGYQIETSYGDGVIGVGAAPEAVLPLIRDFKPDLVGISCIFTFSHQISRAFAASIKGHFPEIKIVFGGTHATVTAGSLILEPYCDFVIRGEGERAMRCLVEAEGGRRRHEDVPGLTFRGADGRVADNPIDFVMDLDSLPRPARHLLDMEFYAGVGRMQGGASGAGARSTTLITSRGCPASCTFCSIHSVWGKAFRGHSADYVLAELEELRTRYRIDHAIFEDDNITHDGERAEAIFRGMIDRDMNMTWETPNGVALWRLTESLVSLIKAAGCIRLCVAIESGNQETLYKIIKKPLNLAKANKIIEYCRRIGLQTTAFFVIGFPDETREAIAISLRYAERVPTGSICIGIATPYPGTELYDQCVKKGCLDASFNPNNLYTRVGVIRTAEFTPELLQRMIARTQLRRALRFPIQTLIRLSEKFATDPGAVMAFLVHRIASKLFPRFRED